MRNVVQFAAKKLAIRRGRRSDRTAPEKSRAENLLRCNVTVGFKVQTKDADRL